MTLNELTAKLQNKEITLDQFQEGMKKLNAERGNKGINNIKLSDKKGLSVKLNSQVKFPTTLYAFQWVQLLVSAGELVDALYQHKDQLAFKDGQGLPSREELVKTIIESLQEKVQVKKAA